MKDRRTGALEALCERFRVEALYAFGSRAAEAQAWLQGCGGALGGGSDVDLGVRPAANTRLGVYEKAQLAIALEDLLGCARVDLVVIPEADPFVAAEIIRGERLYAHDAHAADEYDLYILRRAGDLAPLERERIELVMQGHR